jgi:hypothetical protein
MRFCGGVEYGLGDPDRQRVLPADPVRQFVGCVQKQFRLVDPGDEVDGQGFVRAEDPSGEEDLLGNGLPHQFLKPPARTGRGEDAQPRFRVADPDVRSSDPEVRRIGQFRAATQAVSVEGRDNRHGQFGDPDENRGVDSLQGIVPAPLAQLGDVRSGGKHTVNSSDDQYLRVLLQCRADHM